MTNEQAKQEAIKKAYGDFYEENKGLINIKTGKVTEKTGQVIKAKGLDISFFGGMAMPTSISLIHNNNGWIRIEPDGSNLPKKKINCWFKDQNQVIPICGIFLNDKESIDFVLANATHYQVIEIPQPPIY